MANTTIPNLPAAIALNGTEQIGAVQAGTSVRVTTGQIASLANGQSGNLPWPISLGGTGQSLPLTQYGVVYGSATTAMATTAAGTTGQVLLATTSAAPSWGQVSLTAGVTGVLPIANGGTNSTATPTAGGVGYGTGTAYAYTAAGTAGQVVLSGGSGSPTFTTGTLALAGNLSFTGAFASTFSVSGAYTYTMPGQTDTLAGIAATQTLTNKRVQPRVLASTANSATPTLNTDSYDMMVITGQSVAITSFTTNLTGTPVNGQTLWIAITGTTSIAITWGAKFESSTVTLPTTTSSTNRLDIRFVWNVATSAWRCMAVS